MIKSFFSLILSFVVAAATFVFGSPATAELGGDLKRDGTPKKYFTLSFDDGITQDRAIMEICKKYGFTGVTFNINTGLCGESWDWVGEALGMPGLKHQRFTRQELADGVYSGFDVAVHTLNHPSLKAYDSQPARLKKEINLDAFNIYRYTGVCPLGMAWPGGDTEYTDKTVELVEKYTDMGFARAVTPTCSFSLPEYFLKWQPTCSITDEDVLKYAEDFLNAECTGDMLFYVWGHGYELDRYDAYDTLEQLIKMMSEDENVVCVSNSEFYLLFRDEIPRWKSGKTVC